jgi:hypothetical protein
LSLGAVNAFGVGAHIRYARHLGLAIDYQTTPGIGGNVLRIGTTSTTIAARFYPFGGGFFISGGIATQSVRVHAAANGVSVDAAARATGAAFGLGWMGASGLVIGIDVSVLVPLNDSSVSIVGITGAPSDGYFTEVRNRAEERANALAHDIPIVPQVNLLRVGYLF